MTVRTVPGHDARGGPARAWTGIHRLLFDWIPAALLTVTVAILVADVFGRYLLNSPIVWAPEVALLCFVWLVYLAAVSAAGRSGHIAVDAVTHRLPRRLQATLAALAQLLTLAVFTYLAYYGFVHFSEGRFTSLPAIDLSKRFIELAIPVSSVALGLQALQDLWAALRGIRTGTFGPSSEPESDHTDEAVPAPAASAVSGDYRADKEAGRP